MEFLLDPLRELWAERRRAGLVALGVAWGTLSMTLLLAFGQSFLVATNQTISNFGSNLLRVGGGSTTVPFQGMTAGRFISLHVEDEALLKNGVPQAHTVALEYVRGGGNPLKYRQQRINVPLSGCGPAYEKLRGMVPQAGGRFLNELDVKLHRRVIFLGHRSKQRLFGDGEAIGETVELRNVPFVVIGVRQERVSVSGYDGDDRDKVVIPHTAFRDLMGWENISLLMIGLRDPTQKQAALDAIYQTLATRYRFDANDRDALRIMDYIALDDMINGMLDGNRYFNGVVGFFSLLVAMLGVMNLMYVMVEERSREIGIRMALGARPRQVTSERLTEGIAVTLLGGVAGMAVCATLFAIVNQLPLEPDVRAYLGYPVLSISLGTAIIVLLGICGCLAGWFPARRAAALDPVSALREE
ncbi:MAG: ABC transporter permease [Planctomycetes bacterium]|nr:ABC transporter permease [Planctomycetota bacterium]